MHIERMTIFFLQGLRIQIPMVGPPGQKRLLGEPSLSPQIPPF